LDKIEHLAQKQAENFGRGGFCTIPEKAFCHRIRNFAGDSFKNSWQYSDEVWIYILFDMGTIPEKY
jgi:hypothetical protein